MYLSKFFRRYLSQKKYSDLLNLLYKGSSLLLQRDQQGSGADLAILLIDVLTKSETKPCDEWIEKIAKLFEMMNSSIPEREMFLTNAVKWSMDSSKKGHPLLHKVSLLLNFNKKYLFVTHQYKQLFLFTCENVILFLENCRSVLA